MPNEPARRDWWSIVDILAKVAASVFLAVLAFVIPTASQRIAASLDTGKLVQALMSDLTTANQQTRQDLALIALNRTIGDENPSLVSEIAERIYFDLSARDSLNHGLGRVAFAVLLSRDSARARSIRDSIEAAAATGRGQIVSPANADSVRVAAWSPQAQLVARIHPLVAYIQYHSEGDSVMADSLRRALIAAGFWAPGIERVAGEYQNEIRFFHPVDEAAARRAQAVAEQFLKGRPRLQDLSRKGFKAPEGQIEIWLSLL